MPHVRIERRHVGLSRALVAAAVWAMVALGAEAQEHRTSVGFSAGSPGIGLSLGRSLNERVGVRFAGNLFNYSDEFQETDLTYDATLKLRTVEALVDFHPARNAFRLTGGLVLNGNGVEGTGIPTGGTLVINGTTYTAEEVGTLTMQGDVGSRTIAPYAGLGFGRTRGGSRVFFTLDLGVIFQGTPHVTLAATGPVSSDPGFQADLAAEEAEINQDLDEPYLRYYPVLAVGLGIRF
jgi:hypothetical protein